jgi:hypothetical protein
MDNFFYVIYPHISSFDKCGIKNLEYLHDSTKSRDGDRMMRQREDECKCFLKTYEQVDKSHLQ